MSIFTLGQWRSPPLPFTPSPLGKDLTLTTPPQAFAPFASQSLKLLRSVLACAESPSSQPSPLRPETRLAAAQETRQPLSKAVEESKKLWFEESLKKAKAGNRKMQVVVGQMYCKGYGVPKNENEGKKWISRAGCDWLSVLKLSRKYPVFDIDSDSEEFLGRNWISRASCNRSALKLGRKRPGYNASDSDSEELNEEAK